MSLGYISSPVFVPIGPNSQSDRLTHIISTDADRFAKCIKIASVAEKVVEIKH